MFYFDIGILIIIFVHMTDKHKHTVFKFLDTNYGNLEPYRTLESEYYVFYFLKNEKIIVYNWATKEAHIRYSIVWSFLKNMFGLSDREIIILMSEWLEDRYNIKTSKIDTLNDYQFSWIKKLS
jgi:hypothetical protein